jgi:hypothetical protein
MVSLVVRILRVLCYRARTRLRGRTLCAHRPGSGSPANAIVDFQLALDAAVKGSLRRPLAALDRCSYPLPVDA